MTRRELKDQFPSLVTDRTAEVAYDVSRWLEKPVVEATEDWLAQAFGLASRPVFRASRIRHRLTG
jgi:hypothetical protein